MLLRLYLIAYYLVLAAAVFALWRGGVLGRLPVVWVVVAAGGAVLLGVLLALVSRPRIGS